MSITIHNPKSYLVGVIKARFDIDAAKRYVQTSQSGIGKEGACYGHVHPEAEFWARLGGSVNDFDSSELAAYGKRIDKFKLGWLTKWVDTHDQGEETNMNFLRAFLGGPGSEEAGQAFMEEQRMKPNFIEALMEHGAELIGDPEHGMAGLMATGEQMLEVMLSGMDPRQALDKINEISKAHGHDPEDPNSECESIKGLRAKFGGK